MNLRSFCCNIISILVAGASHIYMLCRREGGGGGRRFKKNQNVQLYDMHKTFFTNAMTGESHIFTHNN